MRMEASTATFELRGWTVSIAGNFVYGRIDGPKHRIDISIAARDGAAARDGGEELLRVGRVVLRLPRRRLHLRRRRRLHARHVVAQPPLVLGVQPARLPYKEAGLPAI